jgi:hypothetical protein
MENTTNTAGFNSTNIKYSMKPSKADIIQRLLTDGHITVEEAMTLMMQEAAPMPVYNPYVPPFRVGDVEAPGHPLWYSDTKFPIDK